jgi:magnesium transporter
MEIFLYRKDAEEVETGFTPEQLPDMLADKTNVVWVDLLGETPEQLEQAVDILTNIFHFHHLTIEDAIETRNQPKIEAFPNYFYFIVHGVKPDETSSSNFVTKERQHLRLSSGRGIPSPSDPGSARRPLHARRR